MGHIELGEITCIIADTSSGCLDSSKNNHYDYLINYSPF